MIQGTVNRKKVHLPASAVVIGYQYYYVHVERVFRLGDSQLL